MERPSVANGTKILRIGLVALGIFASIVLAAWAVGLDLESGRTRSPDGAPADGGKVRVLGELPADISESSGVVVSRRHTGVLWTHEDQGNEPVLHALSPDGRVRASVAVVGAEPEDWEDLALGPCPAGVARGGDCLFLADIGDNGSNREHVVVLVVPEPDPAAGNADATVSARIAFRYPEGPADAEALALGPDGGLLVVTKGQDGTSRLYRVGGGGDAASASSVGDAVLVGALPLDVSTDDTRVTGAAVSPDGRHLAVRSHTAVYLFDLEHPLEAPVLCPIGQRQPQGEAVDFLDDSTLVLTSESPAGRSAPLLELRCP
jgi:hypothetical protein